MPELIDRKCLLAYLSEIKPDKYVSAFGEAAVHVIGRIEEFVKVMPAIEHEPKKVAKWIQQESPNGRHFNCSACGHEVCVPCSEMIDPRDYYFYLDKYCGGCSAKMYQTGGTISKERFAEIMRGDDDG